MANVVCATEAASDLFGIASGQFIAAPSSVTSSHPHADMLVGKVTSRSSKGRFGAMEAASAAASVVTAVAASGGDIVGLAADASVPGEGFGAFDSVPHACI